MPHMITFTAAGLVLIFLAQQQAAFFGSFAVRIVGDIAADHADGVQLGNIIGLGQQSRDRTEGLPLEIHVQAGNDNPDAFGSQRFGYIGQFGIEELGLVYTDHLGIFGQQQYIL